MATTERSVEQVDDGSSDSIRTNGGKSAIFLRSDDWGSASAVIEFSKDDVNFTATEDAFTQDTVRYADLAGYFRITVTGYATVTLEIPEN